MMGHPARALAPIAAVTLADRVPADHVYRHLGRTLALAFVRDLVRDASADKGRPSIDPIVFFRLQPILEAVGRPVQVVALPSIEAVHSLGVLDPTFVAEYEDLFYQYTEPQIVDSSAIERSLGVNATPLAEALRATVRWYREAMPAAVSAA